MPEGDPKVSIEINADAKTGAIDVAAKQLEELSGAASELLGPLAALGTVGGLIVFFKEAASAAEENAQALVHLQAQLGAAGLDVQASTKTVIAWAEALQDSSRFGVPELESALSRVVAKVGDLEKAQKLVQLAMNVSVGTGREFNAELDNLSLAIGGSSRGVTVLQKELGQAAVGITDVDTLLNMLAARYKDNAEKSKTLTDSTAQAKNAFHEMMVTVGDSLMPALNGLAHVSKVIADDFRALWAVLAFGFKGAATEMGAATLTMMARAEETGRVIKAFFTGSFHDVLEAQKDFARTAAQIRKDADKEELEASQKAAKSLEFLEGEKRAAKKNAIKEDLHFEGDKNKADLAQAFIETQAQIAAVKAAEAAILAEKNQSSEMRLAIVKAALDREMSIMQEHKAAYIGKLAQFHAEEVKLTQEAALKKTQIENKYVTDRVAALEQWKAHNAEVMANMQAAGLRMADSISAGIAQSVAKSIVEGKKLETVLKDVSIQVAEQAIADLIKIGIQATITKTIQMASNDATVVSIGAQTAAVSALTTALSSAATAATALDIALAAAE